jgi:uncharacterized protein (TIGR02271 family)
MSHEKVIAVYDTLAHANAAVNTLRSAGYSSSDISIIGNGGNGPKADFGESGYWNRLFGRDIGLHEGGAHGRTVPRSGVTVTIRVPESETTKVIELLDSYRPVNVVDRARTQDPSAAVPKVIVPPPTSAADFKRDEEVVPLAEEQLNVGKLQIDAGITRVRRFSIEKPVEVSITLHEERAEVMRRAISDPDYAKDVDWSEQAIEVTEKAEQPVVNKTVRVIEEVVIRRKGTDHVEIVHDTVRRQELEVEKVPVETVHK